MPANTKILPSITAEAVQQLDRKTEKFTFLPVLYVNRVLTRIDKEVAQDTPEKALKIAKRHARDLRGGFRLKLKAHGSISYADPKPEVIEHDEDNPKPRVRGLVWSSQKPTRVGAWYWVLFSPVGAIYDVQPGFTLAQGTNYKEVSHMKFGDRIIPIDNKALPSRQINGRYMMRWSNKSIPEVDGSKGF